MKLKCATFGYFCTIFKINLAQKNMKIAGCIKLALLVQHECSKEKTVQYVFGNVSLPDYFCHGFWLKFEFQYMFVALFS